MSSRKCCVAAVRVGGEPRGAVKVCINGADVYVNIFDRSGSKQAHFSYHASGQQHIKKSGDYVYWDGGPTGKWEPMKHFKPPPEGVRGREEVQAIGWGLGSTQAVLPPVRPEGDLWVVDLPEASDYAILGFVISVVGKDAIPRADVRGCPVIDRHQFSDAVTVEIEAICMQAGDR